MKRLRLLLLTAALTLALLGAVPAAPAHADPGTLAVSVHIPGARGFAVVVRVWSTTGEQMVNGQVASTETGDTASVQMSVYPGSYRVCFEDHTHTTFVTECWQDQPYDPLGPTLDQVQVTDSTTTQITAELELLGPPPGVISGQATVDGIAQQTYTAKLWSVIDGSVGTEVATTGSEVGAPYEFVVPDGRYRLCVAPLETYDAQFGSKKPRSACWRSDGPAATVEAAEDIVVAGGNSIAADLALPWDAAASVSGTITSDHPAGSVTITARQWPENPGQWWYVPRSIVDLSTGSATYTITDLDPDLTHRVCASGEGVMANCWIEDLDLAEGESRTRIDLALTAAGTLSGHVSSVYLAAEGSVQLTLFRQEDGTWVERDAQLGPSSAGGMSQPFDYTFGPLDAGVYRVCAHHYEPELGIVQFEPTCFGGPTLETADDVVLGYEDVTGVDFQLGRPSKLTGTVTGGGTGLPVELFTKSGTHVATVTTGADGEYVVPTLPSGEYRLAFHRLMAESTAAAEYWDDVADGSDLTAWTVLDLPPETTLTANAALSTGAAVAGSVREDDGAPIAGCRIEGNTERLAGRFTTTGTDGTFRLGGLSAGSYLLRLVGGCGLADEDLFYDATSPTGLTSEAASADAIPLTLGQTMTLSKSLGGTPDDPPPDNPPGAQPSPDVPELPRTMCLDRTLQGWQRRGYTVIVGTPRPDSLHGTSGKDLIIGGAGDDRVRAGAGRDVVCGGRGADELHGGRGRDRLSGGPGADRLYGGSGRDRVRP